MKATVVFLLLCPLCGMGLRQLTDGESLKVGYVSESVGPAWVTKGSSGGCASGFECSLISELCTGLKATCTQVDIGAKQDRLKAVTSGQVDFLVGQVSVTPDRASQVTFAKPYYYQAGATLFVPEGSSTSLDWPSLTTGCIVSDYYALADIEKKYPSLKLVKVADTKAGADAVNKGECQALIGDNSLPVPGLKLASGASLILDAPYGIIVGPENSDLASKLGAELAKVQPEGLQKLEKDNLVPAGIAALPQATWDKLAQEDTSA